MVDTRLTAALLEGWELHCASSSATDTTQGVLHQDHTGHQGSEPTSFQWALLVHSAQTFCSQILVLQMFDAYAGFDTNTLGDVLKSSVRTCSTCCLEHPHPQALSSKRSYQELLTLWSASLPYQPLLHHSCRRQAAIW